MIDIVVSIIIPTYNRAELIKLALGSVLKQSFQNWELLVIDNESTDRTKEVVELFAAKDIRIKYFSVKKNPKSGISSYLNFGMNEASGKYIARLDDDDEWFDAFKLEKQVKFLEQHQDYVVVGGGAIMVDQNRKEIYRFLKREKDDEIRNNALYANPFWHNTVMFVKRMALEIGGYNDLRFVEDWDLWLRLGLKGKFYNMQEHLSLYMNAGQNLSVSNQKLAAKTILKLIDNFKDFYPNGKKAKILNSLQLVYSYTPKFFRRMTQNFLFYIKRNYF